MVWPEDLALVNERLKTLSPENPVVVIENRVFGAGGEVRWGQFVNRAFFGADGTLREIQSVGRDISDRKLLEAQLAAATARVQDLYDNAPCGYYSLDAQGRYVHINALALSWLGCAREEVVGKLSPQDFFTAEGKAVFREKLHRVRNQLHRINREQEVMLDNDLVGIARVRDRRVIWKNRALERIFGYKPGELLGRSTRVLYLDDASYRSLGDAAYPALETGGQYRTQMAMAHKSGAPIWVDSSGVQLSAETGESLWLMLDITPMKQYQESVEHIAFHDALTGLPNRLLLADRMKQARLLCDRRKATMAVCYVDIDGFKTVNDRFGHPAGDRLLIEVARRLQGCVRADDTVSRLGGDEFILLLAGLDDRHECESVVQRVLSAFHEPFLLDEQRAIEVSASIGVALYPEDAANTTTLISLADEAMYQAKQSGKNEVCYSRREVVGD